MYNILNFCLIAVLAVIISVPAEAQEEKGRGYYDFGVFAYEDGDYEDAEKNLKKALGFNPNHPFYNHYMGKTFLKTGRYQEASEYFNSALKADPDIPGLKYDMAFLDYKMSDYSRAAEQFKEVAEAEPENVLAYYYAGISLYNLNDYDEAARYFTYAAEKSPTISANGYYYAGICYQKAGQIDKAAEMLEYVKEYAGSESLRANAEKWLESVKKQKKTLRPYGLYLKIGRRYDDNVRLVSPDQEIDEEGEDEGDSVTVGYFSGNYKFVNEDVYKIGAGYSHYQTWYDDLDMYDLTGSIFNFYTQYRSDSFVFGLAYLPSYYWADNESYLRRHQLRPEIIWQAGENLITRLTYSYNKDDYLQNDVRSGHASEVFLDAYYSLPKGKGNLFGGFGYEKNTAYDSYYDYGQLKVKMGLSLNIPWDLNFTLTGKYYGKKYDDPDPYFENEKRDDGKYIGSVSLSHSLFYEWLSLSGEFSYTKNDSNFKGYDYEKKTGTLSVIMNY